MKLIKLDENFNTVLNEVKQHKEYDYITRLFGLKISSDGAVCGMVNDGVIHSITLTPLKDDYGFTGEYRLRILNTQTGDRTSFDGSINSIRTILGMDSIYVPTGDMSEPHITISDGCTNIHVFKNDIVCVDVVDENISIWANFNMMDNDIKLPVNSEMLLEFSENEYNNIRLSCMTMNNMVSDLVKKLFDDEDELY